MTISTILNPARLRGESWNDYASRRIVGKYIIKAPEYAQFLRDLVAITVWF